MILEIKISSDDINDLWKFSKNRNVNIHYLNISYDKNGKKEYLYEVELGDEELYLMLRLAVPRIDVQKITE